MANEILNSLLREYEQKKINAELDLEKRKENLYDLIPRLRQIENELNKMAISTAKGILSNNNSNDDSVNNLKENIERLKKERESILKENNYSLDYLKPFYECKICNDTGYVTDSNYHTTMCSCLKQKLLDISFNKSNMYNIKKENFSTFNENLYSDEINVEKYKVNTSPRKNIQYIKENCIKFVENFDSPEQKNLLFSGPTGLR